MEMEKMSGESMQGIPEEIKDAVQEAASSEKEISAQAGEKIEELEKENEIGRASCRERV